MNAFHITWTHSMDFGGMGDLVSRGTAQVNKEAIRELTDEKKFLARVRQLRSTTKDPDAKKFWDAFMETWEKRDHDFHDR